MSMYPMPTDPPEQVEAEPERPSEAPPPKASWRRRPGCLVALGIVAFLVLFGVIVGAISAAKPAGRDTAVLAEIAKSACRDAVKSRLRAPGSARFSGEYATTSSWDGDPLTLRAGGTVEAANALGGTRAVDYKCDVTLSDVDSSAPLGQARVSSWVER